MRSDTAHLNDSIYKRIGGGKALRAVVDDFYRRVLADPVLVPFFASTDLPGLKAHQIKFMTAALGGPNGYSGRDMRAAHAGLGIRETHFDAVAGHLVAALNAAGVSNPEVERIVAQVAPLKHEICASDSNPTTNKGESKGMSTTKSDSILDQVAGLRSMVDNMPVNVLVANLDFELIYMNKASRDTLEKLERYLPFPVAKLTGKSIDVFHKNPSMQRSMLSNPRNLPHRANINVGPETLSLLVSAIINDHGEYVGPMVTWEIVTEKLKNEFEMARIRSMMENAPVNVIYADTDLTIRYLNPASMRTLKSIEHLLPIRAEEVIGKSVDTFHKNPAMQRQILGNPRNLPHRALIDIGPEKADLLVSPIYDAKGTYLGPMVTWSIVTQQVRTKKTLGETVGTLDRQAQTLGEVASGLAAASEETSSQAQSVSVASEEVTSNMHTVSSASEEMAATIKEIAKSASQAASVAGTAVTEAAKAKDTIAKLGESSNEIGNVIKAITSIAQQTNLLALNATIEAARAGEAGKGFAVVANEVKELAKQTAAATVEITQKIESIQADTASAVEAIEKISGVIQNIDEINNTIASAVEEQASTTNEISRNVSQASEGTQGISKNISNVATAANEASQGASKVQVAAGDLNKLVATLKELMASNKE